MHPHRLYVFTVVPGRAGKQISRDHGDDARLRMMSFGSAIPICPSTRRSLVTQAVDAHRRHLRQLGVAPSTTVLTEQVIAKSAATPSPLIGASITV